MPEADHEARVFISYRRNDTKALARLMADYLGKQLGSANVFFDVASIPIATDFYEELAAQMQTCTVVLALIGTAWARSLDVFGSNDVVAAELRAALEWEIPIIPIFAEGAPAPKAQSLPPDLQVLLRRHGLVVDSGCDFPSHMQKLLGHVHEVSRGYLQGQSQCRAEHARSRASSNMSLPFLSKLGYTDIQELNRFLSAQYATFPRRLQLWQSLNEQAPLPALSGPVELVWIKALEELARRGELARVLEVAWQEEALRPALLEFMGRGK